MSTTDSRNIARGTAEYDEVTRILGRRCRWVADESVRQIDGRWLKATCFVPDANGDHALTASGDELVTARKRIRIPRDSFMRGRRPRHG
ncbi:hypothetical protein [Rhodococcus daqingensis]|uniref:Uncharacterized protein n=1 Tax=Rhodococcus daqingensis TaxID=2479363 RepID=A0ABW2S3P3_9NOCA